MTRSVIEVSPRAAREPACVALVLAARSGDWAAFASLYELHARSLYNMILRSVRDPHAAEDVAQDVWTKAHRELGKLREPRCFPAWLYRIAAKKCIDASRRRARQPAAGPLSDGMSAALGDPESAALAREDAARVWEALAGLSPKQHMALYLREAEERTYREIAYVLNISETAVGLCIFRARRSLAAAYAHLQAAPLDACASTHRAMSLSMDGQATPIQQRALEIHLDRCAPCRSDFTAVQAAARGYAGLALAPAPLAIRDGILGAATAAKTTGGAVGIGKLIATFAPSMKAAVVTGAALATVSAATVVAAQHAADIIGIESAHHAAPAAGASDGTAGEQRGDASAADQRRPSDADRAATDDRAADGSTGVPGAPDTSALLPDSLLPPQPPASVEKPLGDSLEAVGGTLDGTLETVDDTLDGAITTVDETLDGVDETLDETLEDVNDTIDGVDETLDGVDETLDGATDVVEEIAPILGPPAPETGTAPEPAPTPEDADVLDPVDDLLPTRP